jgi:hypothetical protein
MKGNRTGSGGVIPYDRGAANQAESDLELFESSSRPLPAKYWPSGKRWLNDVSAKEFHWSFWVAKPANCAAASTVVRLK